ncbi:MAG TPA: hypothetical protein VE619_05555 [Nitrososphaeraceae archaeon]|nr:hypothetical protein [Nitrososphaeraceae archaeon]
MKSKVSAKILITISLSDFENLLHLIENISERISIASGYAHLKYSTDTSCNETASLVTRMERLMGS